MKRLWLCSALLLAAAGLSACGGDGGSGGSATVTPPAATTTFADRFGSGFGAAFRANANTDPRAVAAGDLDPVNSVAVPLAFQ